MDSEADATDTNATPTNPAPPRTRIGAISLLAACSGAVTCHLALASGRVPDPRVLRIVSAGFEAALVGGLADWFAVTALFRRPLGLPIPHTALLVERRAKLIEGIVAMVEHEWLGPDVIRARLERVAPSAFVIEWLRDPEHVGRLGAPVRDLLRALAGVLSAAEVAEFAERTIERELRALPLDASAGRWLAAVASSPTAGTAFDSLAISLANLADRPRTALELRFWLDRSARKLREDGKRLVPLFLRRKIVQRKIVEAVCGYASSELRSAAGDAEHPLRSLVFTGLQRFAERLATGDEQALAHLEQIRAAVLEALETGPFVRGALAGLRAQLEQDLEDPQSALSALVDRQLRHGILDLLAAPGHAESFDRWVRTTALDLVQRHHHEIGRTVRERLEALSPDELVAQIEARVGGDLQFIRLNGAVVGGMIGVLLALARLVFAN